MNFRRLTFHKQVDYKQSTFQNVTAHQERTHMEGTSLVHYYYSPTYTSQRQDYYATHKQQHLPLLGELPNPNHPLVLTAAVGLAGDDDIADLLGAL